VRYTTATRLRWIADAKTAMTTAIAQKHHHREQALIHHFFHCCGTAFTVAFCGITNLATLSLIFTRGVPM